MFWKVVYNYILFPLFVFISLILCLFNRKIREGIIGRIKSYKHLKHFINSVGKNRLIYWFHVASLGEYEQARPVMSGLKEVEPHALFIMSFFSPSGYNHVDDDQIDCKIYLPMDFFWIIKKSLRLAKPKKLILAAYDVWPNLIWSAKSLGIHTSIFAAKFSKNTSKSTVIIRQFYKSVYNQISTIYTISDKDYNQLAKILFPSIKPIIRVLGNPRYDQVKQKSDKFTEQRTKSVLLRPKRLLIGSAHIEDEDILLGPIITLMTNIEDLSLIWAPHEPNHQNIEKIKNYFISKSLSVELLGNKEPDNIDTKVIIVDSVGRLSQLYWAGQIAYVGGGFSSGVHNVMEPAIARLPIFFGPKYDNFPEALELINVNGASCIKDGNDFILGVNNLFKDNNYFLKASYAATDVIHRNLGSATRIVRGIIHD
jgi:3-deoxy-D-manno-octulosonic-acid transferase